MLSLVGGRPTPLKNMSSSVGMMTFPTEWKNQSHVPNHQPVCIYTHMYIYIYYRAMIEKEDVGR